MLASAATGWSERCRVGLVNSPTGVLRLCHGALKQALNRAIVRPTCRVCGVGQGR
jgi:hypothetical protein